VTWGGRQGRWDPVEGKGIASNHQFRWVSQSIERAGRDSGDVHCFSYQAEHICHSVIIKKKKSADSYCSLWIF
jgi:hypothetical protein